MGIPAINSLMNMEYMLYGGRSGLNVNCPSYANGYLASNAVNYPYYNGLGYYNPTFKGGYNQDIFTASNSTGSTNNGGSLTQAAASNPQFKGLSDDLNAVADYYIKSSVPSESLKGAATGGLTFAAIQNPRVLVHPYNSIMATFSKDLNKMFADIRVDKSPLNLLYMDKKGGYEIVSEAYFRMHKMESLMNHSKLGLFRKSLKNVPGGEAQYKEIKEGLKIALEKGDAKAIAMWTEKAKRLTNAFTGFIPTGMKKLGIDKPFAWLRKTFINPTHYQEIAGVVEKNVAESGAKTTLGKSLTHSCGIGNGLFFAAFEFLNDFLFEKKIQKAFDKDNTTGWTQVGQTAVKGVGSAVGWAVGEGIGAWAGGKLGMIAGAKLGTVISPGVGTVIGAVAGLVGGSIGCWLMGKVTHSIIGDDVATKAEADKLKQTAQGQKQLLEITAMRAQDDKKLDQRTAQAITNVAQFYGVA